MSSYSVSFAYEVSGQVLISNFRKLLLSSTILDMFFILHQPGPEASDHGSGKWPFFSRKLGGNNSLKQSGSILEHGPLDSSVHLEWGGNRCWINVSQHQLSMQQLVCNCLRNQSRSCLFVHVLWHIVTFLFDTNKTIMTRNHLRCPYRTLCKSSL